MSQIVNSLKSNNFTYWNGWDANNTTSNMDVALLKYQHILPEYFGMEWKWFN